MNITIDLKSASEQLKEVQQLLQLAIEKETISSIERDLILEKLRKAYDSILFAGEKEKQIIIDSGKNQPVKINVEKIPEIPQKVSTPEIVPQTKTESTQPKQKTQTPDKPRTFERKSIFDPVKKDITEIPDEKKSVIENPREDKQNNEHSVPNSNRNESIAEKFQGKQKSMTDSLSNQLKSQPVAAKLKDAPITDLTKEIGIHDKLQFIKELFNGDNALFENTINKINQFDDIAAALIYLQENFDWSESNSAANKFIDLIRRKLLKD